MSDLQNLKIFKATDFRKVQKNSDLYKNQFKFGSSQVYRPKYVCNVALPTSTHILHFQCFLIEAKIPLLLGERFLKQVKAKINIVDNLVESDFGNFSLSSFQKFSGDQTSDAFNIDDDNYEISHDTETDDYPTDSKNLRRLLQKRYPKLRKFFGLTRTQLTKLHAQRHVGADQTLRNLRAILTEEQQLDGDVNSFLTLIGKQLMFIRKNCSVCNSKKKANSFPQLLANTNLNFNQKISADVMVGRDDCPYNFLIIVDHSTGFCRFLPFSGRFQYQIALSLFLENWIGIFGPPKQLILDQDGPFLKSSPYLESLGIFISPRPSGSHAPAGRVERKIGVFRESVEQDAEFLKNSDIHSVRCWSALMENSVNNASAGNAGSPALRVFGFTTTLEYNALTDTGNSVPAYFPWEARDRALEAYKRATASDTLRRTLASSSNGAEVLFEPGTPVWVYHRTTSEKLMKRQSAIVLSFDSTAMVYQVKTMSGGVISVSRRDVVARLDDDLPTTTDIAQTLETILERDNIVSDSQIDCPRCKNRRSKKPHTCGKSNNSQGSINFQGPAISSIFKTDDISNSFSKPEAFSKTEVTQETSPKFQVDASEFKNDMTNVLFCDCENIFSLVEYNSYALDWDDLSEEAKQLAYKEAADVYFRNEVWKRGFEKSDAEFQKYAKDKKIVKLDGRLVKKAKIDPKKPSQLKGKVRLTGRGFKDKLNDNTSNESPTVHPTTIQLNEFFGLRAQEKICAAIDFENAFFKISENKTSHLSHEVWMSVPLELTGGRKIWRKMFKEAQGQRGAARSWFETLRELLTEFGFTQSRTDPCLFLFWEDSSLTGHLVVHVDDARFWAEPHLHKKFSQFLKERQLFSDYNYGFSRSENGVLVPFPECDDPSFSSSSKCSFLGVDISVDLVKREATLSQQKYIDAKLKPLPLTKAEKADDNFDLNHRQSEFLKAMGSLMWLTTKTQFANRFESSYLASKRNRLTTADFVDFNKTVAQIKEQPLSVLITGFTGKIKMVLVCDGSETSKKTERGYTGRVCGFMPGNLRPGEPGLFVPISVRTGKSPRATHSSFDIECVASIQVLDEALSLSIQTQEFLMAPQTKLHRTARYSFFSEGTSKLDFSTEMHSDAELLCNAVNKITMVNPTLGVRRREDVDDLKTCLQTRDLAVVAHISGKLNPTDRLTKPMARCSETHGLLLRILMQNFYDPPFSG